MLRTGRARFYKADLDVPLYEFTHRTLLHHVADEGSFEETVSTAPNRNIVHEIRS